MDGERGRAGPEPAEEALHHCQLIQNLVDISVSSLRALRTRCAASNDLTQREIRTLEVQHSAYLPVSSAESCSVVLVAEKHLLHRHTAHGKQVFAMFFIYSFVFLH